MLFRSERYERRSMVRKQIANRGITDRRVLGAMAQVPREQFVPDDQRHLAYADKPLPIGFDQTISQPYIVALMAEQACLNRHSRVLEIGTGSGYAAAVFARIARHVWTIERLKTLADDASHRFVELGIDNITTIVRDGAVGYPDAAPYDAIIVAAAAPHTPARLRAQLAAEGSLIIPVGDRTYQDLCVIRRTDDGFAEHSAGACRFVPLVSPEAFND